MAIDIRVFNSFEAAKETWLHFQEKGELYFFQSYEWLENWFAHIGGEASIEPCLVGAFTESGEPLCFFAFGIAKRYSVRMLVWLGGSFVDYGAPILCPPILEKREEGGPDFKGLWNAVLARIPRVDAVWLRKIPARINERENPLCTLPCERYHSGAYHANLSGSWNEFYERHASAVTRSKDRRKERRLSEMGELSFDMTDGSDQSLFEKITRAMIEQKKGRYREIRAADLLGPESHRRFFLEPTPALLASGALHVSALSLGDTIIAAHWGMAYRGRFYHFMPSFASGPWVKYSSGRFLLFRLLQWCFEHGIKVFDFTLGDESYKRDWCEAELGLFQLFRALSWKGRMVEIVYHLSVIVLGNELCLGAARSIRRFTYRLRYFAG